MKKLLFFVLLLFFILLNQQTIAQDTPADSASYLKAITYTRHLFTKTIGINSYLYNGTAYARYWNGIVGNPFFEWDNFQKGALDYQNAFYDSILLKYDLFKDALITKTFANDAEIKLIPDKIAAFSIGSRHFIKLNPDSLTHASVIKPGFYEILYNGNIHVLARHEKRIEKSTKIDENFSKFIQYDTYYIEKEEKYYLINSEADLLSLFKDQKADVKKMLNNKESGYRKNPAGAIIGVAEYYDRLKK